MIDTFDKVMKLKSSVPKGKSGIYEIDDFYVSSKDATFFNTKEMINGRIDRCIKRGRYKRLYRGSSPCGAVIMSDTPAEKRDHIHFIMQAKGNVLINGLGLGWVVEALFEKKEVDSVTVVEISEDVIKLTGKYLKEKYGNRLTIINSDALKYKLKKNEKYDCVWHDIWDDICADNWETMTKLHRKYAKRCNYQDSWVRDRVKYLRTIDY